MLFVPIYEYRCEECGKRSSALLSSFSSADPVCPHCGKPALRRLVSTFATARSSESEGVDFSESHEHDHDEFGGGGDEFGGGEDFGGGDFGDDDY